MTFSLKHLLIGNRERHLLLFRYRRFIANSKGYKRTVNVIGWSLFVLSSILYFLTLYPSVPFWDSGEFISSAYGLQIAHEPGAPLYQLLARIFALFSFGNEKLVAPLVNSLSAFASGLSIMLLFRIFLYLFNKYSEKYVGNIVAAFIASSIFALTDSFWTSSTEAEVYTLSFLFTTLCLWTVLRWEERPHEKYIVLICFLLGLSFCIHPLTLLVIPAIVLIIYFHYKRISFKSLLWVCLISISCLFVFYNAFVAVLWLIKYLGVLLFLFIFLMLCVSLLFLAKKKNKPLINTIVFCAVFFLLGSSVYLVTLIRGSQSLPMNEYSVKNAQELKTYVSRNAYIQAPLFYGPYYTALPPKDFEIKDNHLTPVFDKELCTFFPRMWNYTSAAEEDGYVSWVGQPEHTVTIDGLEREKPSFKQNLTFFLNYQTYYMYFRYLLWNFSGKTNDVQGFGDIYNGNWQTGYPHPDKLLGVDEGKIPSLYENKGKNKYFAIPLILCLFGIFYHIGKDAKRFLFVLAIFVMYSIAIVIFLNNSAYEPRERDYIYLPSFMAVSIWIGIGILGISQIIVNILRIKKPRYILPIFIIVPVWIGIQNFNDHNHHHQYTAYNFAYSMLNSCDKNAILFVDGDNDTYPLWYLQNVEHIRQDVRVINRSLLNNPYTISQLKQSFPENPALKLLITEKDYEDGTMDEVQITPSFDTLSLNDALLSLYKSKGTNKKFKNCIKDLHTNKFFFVRGDKKITILLDNAVLSKSDIVILDILANNPHRPVYFSSWSNENFLCLDDYLSLEGFAYKLEYEKIDTEPEIIAQKAGYINSEKMYHNIMHNFSFKHFNKNIYFNETERNMVLYYAQTMSALAYKLLQEGENDKALSVANKIIEEIPYKIHAYPLVLGDLAIVYSVLGEKEKAQELMSWSLKEFKKYINKYSIGSMRLQSQQRLEAERQITYYMNLCLLAEDWGEEDLRIQLSECFFSVIRPYLEITYRQKKMMLLDSDYYEEEINHIDELISQIFSFAQHYEEELPQES